jgi:hypothetical protein
MSEPARDLLLERLDPFVGEWTLEATFPAGGPTGVAAHAVFEWILGGQFLLERSEVAHPDAPDGFCVVEVDAGTGGYRQHYFDSRGIARLYAMDFSDGVWTLLRESADFSPLPFAQRFTGTFADDGKSIDGRWETSRDGSAWELDFGLTYTKLG